MLLKKLTCMLLLASIFLLENCAPSLRSAKIQPGISVDGVFLGTSFTATATDAQGNDATDTSTDFSLPIPFDMRFRYGWEREQSFGFELSGGLDGQLGAYLELPGSEQFHWGLGAETNIWIIGLSSQIREDEDENVADFLINNNYNLYLMAGFIPSKKFEISAGIKYQPFLKDLLEAASTADISVSGTLPVTFLLDGRYMLSDNWGLMAGAEMFFLSFEADNKSKVSLDGGYIYFGLTLR